MSLAETVAPAPLGIWILAMRPRTLTISLAPLAAAAAFGWHLTGQFLLLPFAAALVSALAIQIATNLFNDAADGARGHDGADRKGPMRVTASGLLPARSVLAAGWLFAALAALAGLVCVWHGGWPILAIGIASLAAGYAYSNGPRPISFTPLGEVFVVAFFGVAAVMGTAVLSAEFADHLTLLLGVAVGLPAAAVLMVNNHRDRHEDAENGRRTLAIVLGSRASALAYAAMLLAPLALLLVIADLSDAPVMAAAIVLAPIALGLARSFRALPVGPGLNRLLGQTALYQLALAATVVVGSLA